MANLLHDMLVTHLNVYRGVHLTGKGVEVRRGSVVSGELLPEPTLSLRWPNDELKALHTQFTFDELYIKASEIYPPLQVIHATLLSNICDTTLYELFTRFTTKYSELAAKELGRRAAALKVAVESALLYSPDSSLLTYSFIDDLTSMLFIDEETTTVQVNNELGIAIIPNSVIKKLTIEDITVKVSLSGETYKALKDIQGRSSALIHRRVYSSRVQSPVTMVVDVHPKSINLTAIQGVLFELAANNGVEQIAFLITYVDGTTIRQPVKMQMNKSFVSLERTKQVKRLSIEFTSTVIDGIDHFGSYHSFIVQGISLINKMPGNEKYYLRTKTIEFKDRAGELVKIHSVVCDSDATKGRISIDYYDEQSQQWVLNQYLEPRKSYTLSPQQWMSNYDVAQPTTGKYIMPLADISVAFNNVNGIGGIACLLPAAVPEILHSTSNIVMRPENIFVLRGVGHKHVPTPSFPNQIVDENAGWLRGRTHYETIAYFQKNQTLSVDFGQNHIRINGSSVQGKFTFEEGVYRIGIPRRYWHPLQAGMSDVVLRHNDPYYPYNLRYLIQGYYTSAIYQGVPLFARERCSYVEADLLLSKLITESEYFSVLPITPESYIVILPVSLFNPGFYRESIYIQASLHDVDTEVSQFRLTFEFSEQTQGVLMSYYLLRGI